jgi:hypothetical protein
MSCGHAADSGVALTLALALPFKGRVGWDGVDAMSSHAPAAITRATRIHSHMIRMLTTLMTVAAILLGIGIGCIPFLMDCLHWNYLLIPIGGALFGAAFAWLEFLCARGMRKAVSIKQARVLALGIVVAYFATDIGVYLSARIPVRDSTVLTDGTYPLRELLSFVDYMTLRLDSSAFVTRHMGTIKLGQAGTVLQYLYDLVAAGVGAFLMFRGLLSAMPYCERCARYMKVKRSFVAYLPPGSDVAELIAKIRVLSRGGRRDDLLGLLQALPNDNEDEVYRNRVSATECVCPGCKAAALTGKVFASSDTIGKKLTARRSAR